ncbi:MAG: hypothetical protein IT437_05360 [Phycisphaerales bacterium]|nr:hypothetical protein [Phycisphaerales bacterium]
MNRAAAMLLALIPAMAGCVLPSDRLAFPAPLASTPAERAFDTNADGRPDFWLLPDARGRLRELAYDDDADGAPDRVYEPPRDPDAVPHLIILFDSIPYEPVAQRAADAAWTWFDPPVKVIPPFPTMSPVIFSRLLGAPPLPGVINEYYDREAGRRADRLSERVRGHGNPWERRLNYRLKYWENGLSFLYPHRWFRVDLARAKAAFDSSPDRVTVVYLASTAGLVSKYGLAGVNECLDGLDQLVMQVLYERRGAVEVSVMADHGHNLRPGTRIDLAAILKGAGFRPSGRLRTPDDVVIEQDGLVNYAGVHTRRAADVAAALAARPEIELAMYLDGDRVIVRGEHGRAAIQERGGRYRYTAIDADVLALLPAADSLAADGRADADGFIAAGDWFNATVNHRFPDAPPRLWEAFHGIVVNTPDVLLTTRPGCYTGLSSFDWWVDMASTHGGLDQQDSATFLLTTTGRATAPLRTESVMHAIEPEYNPGILRR